MLNDDDDDDRDDVCRKQGVYIIFFLGGVTFIANTTITGQHVRLLE